MSHAPSFPSSEQVGSPGPVRLQDIRIGTDDYVQQYLPKASTATTPPFVILFRVICGFSLLHILTQLLMGKSLHNYTTWPNMLCFSFWLACAMRWYFNRLVLWLTWKIWYSDQTWEDMVLVWEAYF